MVDLRERQVNKDEGVDQGQSEKSVSDEQLAELEKKIDEPAYSSESDTPFTYKKGDDGSGRFSGLKKRAKKKNSFMNKKVMLALGGLGGALIALLIWIIIIFMGTLLIPQLAQEMVGYQFARVTSEFADNAVRITDEKLAVEAEAENPTIFDAIQEKFSTATASATELWGNMLDQFSATRAINNLKVNNGLAFNYEPTGFLGRSKLTSIVLDTTTYDVKEQGFTKYIPILSSIVKAKNDFDFSQNLASSLNGDMRLNDAGFIARSSAAADFREQANIGLVAWTAARLSDFLGKSPADARVLQQKALVDDIDAPVKPDPGIDSELNTGESNVENAANATEQSDASIKTEIDNGGVDPAVEAALTSSTANTALSTVVGAANPIYKIAMPLCIVYDGSLENSGTTIDNATAQQASAFYYIQAAADQEKTGGSAVNAEAVGALNNTVNAPTSTGQYGVEDSVPETRASGGTVDTSGTSLSGETSADGQFTILQALFGSSTTASLVSDFATKACPYMTNIYLGAGLGLANIAAIIFTGGAEEGTLGTTAESVSETLDTEAASAAGSSIGDLFASGINASTRVVKMVLGTAKTVGELTGVTLAAKLIVMTKAAQVNNGTAQGNDLVNEADAGGNVVANEADQQGFYGAPLDSTAVSQSNAATTVALANKESQKSFSQRYFALDNYSSLLSRIGMTLYTHLNGSFFSTITNEIGKIFNPVAMVSDIFGSLGSKAAAAAGTVDTADYGNVQFGWSQAEEKLINSSASYNPLENQNALDTAAQISGEPAEQYISGTYGVCFTDSIGTLLSKGFVVRDSQGNVVDNQGLCSPDHLGPNNLGGLVFRWRLAMAYTNTLNELSSVSNPGT